MAGAVGCKKAAGHLWEGNGKCKGGKGGGAGEEGPGVREEGGEGGCDERRGEGSFEPRFHHPRMVTCDLSRVWCWLVSTTGSTRSSQERRKNLSTAEKRP